MNTSLPNIPRDAWSEHPNYPEHVLLLGSHANFRRVSRHLVDRAWSAWTSGGGATAAPAMRDLYVRWKSAMKNHERYEERKLYPYLEKRYDTSMRELEEQHEELGRVERSVLRAFENGDPLEVAHHLRKHDEVLVEHLAREEDTVIPLLLELRREEFAAFVS